MLQEHLRRGFFDEDVDVGEAWKGTTPTEASMKRSGGICFPAETMGERPLQLWRRVQRLTQTG